MAISPVQIISAIGLDYHDQDMNCQISPVQWPDSDDTNMNTSDKCEVENSGLCIDLSMCMVQTNFTFTRFLFSLKLPAGAMALLKFTTNSESISTNYPELLKRPPKA